MTIFQIIEGLQNVKPISRAQVFRYIRNLKIKPIGARQRPQQYPDDCVERILSYLGFPTFAAHNGISAVAAKGTVHKQVKNRVTTRPRHPAEKIVSMKQLKKVRKK